jgi:hypothetical protein
MAVEYKSHEVMTLVPKRKGIDVYSYDAIRERFYSDMVETMILVPKRKDIHRYTFDSAYETSHESIDIVSGIPLIKKSLMLLLPTLALTTAESHAGGAFTTGGTLTLVTPTIASTAENSMLLIDTCETNIWDEYVAPNVTSTIDAVVYKIGTHSAKMDVAVDAAVGRLATLDIASTDLTTYNYIKMWVYSTVTISSNDLLFLLDDTAACVTPLKSLDIGALTANTWTEVILALGDASTLTAIISIGVNMAIDKGAFIFYVDQVRATKGV